MGTHSASGEQQHGLLDYISLILLFCFPLGALILGFIAIGMAHHEGRKASWMAVLAAWGSLIAFVVAVILTAYIVTLH